MYEPPSGIPRLSASYEEHPVTIGDLRPLASTLSLEAEGFDSLATRARCVTSMTTRKCALRTTVKWRIPLPQRQVPGAFTWFDHTVRRRFPPARISPSGSCAGNRYPAYTTTTPKKSGPQRVRDLLPEEADDFVPARSPSSTCGARFAGRSKTGR